MFVVSNLTKVPFSFQGVTIPAYGKAEFARITDFIALSALFNAGKATYSEVKSAVAKPAPVQTTVAPVAAVDAAVDVVEEPAEPVTAAEDEPKFTFGADAKAEEVVETEPEVVPEKPVTKRGRRSNKDEK